MKFTSEEENRQYLKTEICQLMENLHRCIGTDYLERAEAEYRKEHPDMSFSTRKLMDSVFIDAFEGRPQSELTIPELEIKYDLLNRIHSLPKQITWKQFSTGVPMRIEEALVKLNTPDTDSESLTVEAVIEALDAAPHEDLKQAPTPGGQMLIPDCTEYRQVDLFE